MHRRLIAAGLVALLCMVSGCARIEVREKAVRLSNITNAYRKAVRWGEFEVAGQFIRHRDETSFTYDEDFLAGIRVTSMEFTRRDMIDSNAEEAVVSAEITFYHVDTGSVKTMLDEQVWWFDASGGMWYLDGGFPDFAGALGRR